MSKIFDWSRAYWRNASGSREFGLNDRYEQMVEDGSVPEGLLCVYENAHGDEVAYQLSPTEEVETEVEVEVETEEGEEPETTTEIETETVFVHGGKYVVTLNDEVLTGPEVTQAVEAIEQESAAEETAAFGSRGAAREFSAEWRRQFGSPEAMGYAIEVEDFDPSGYEIGDLSAEELEEGVEYDTLREIAKRMNIKASQSHADLAAQLSGDEEPELTKEAREEPQEAEAE